MKLILEFEINHLTYENNHLLIIIYYAFYYGSIDINDPNRCRRNVFFAPR